MERPPLPLGGVGLPTPNDLPTPHDLSSASRQGDDRKRKEDESPEREGGTSRSCVWSEPSLTRVLVAPVLAPVLSPTEPCSSHRGKPTDHQATRPLPALPPSTSRGSAATRPLPALPPPTSRGSAATQDCSISSTTPYKHSPNQQQPMGCHIQPVARQQAESVTSESCQGQTSAVTVSAPKTRVCSAPSET